MIRELHRNPYFHVNDRDGFYTLEYDHAQTVILPVVEQRAVVLVRVIRPLLNDEALELPAGGAEPGETPVEAARRELAEEAGIRVADLGRFVPLPAFHEHPCRMPERPYLFRIDLSRREWEERCAPDHEITEVGLFSFEEIRDQILNSGIYLASPVAILARLLLQQMPAPPAKE